MIYKTVFISDTHLLNKKSCYEELNAFLKEMECQQMYAVGDIIDIWRLQINSKTDQSRIAQGNISIIRKLLKKIKGGMEFYYLPGNHDELLLDMFDEFSYDRFHMIDQLIYETSAGKKYLVLHGHQFDLIVRKFSKLSKIGDHAYHFLIWINKYYNRIRKLFGFKYHSLSKSIKVRSKKAMFFINNFEEACVRKAKELDCDGVIAGHIHNPDSKKIDNIHYINLGCWTDKANCTYAYEDHDGNIKLNQYG